MKTILTTTEVEREAWISYKNVFTRFVGNNKDPDYVTFVANMLEKFKVLGCLMSLKIHFFFKFAPGICSGKSWCTE
jgi:hypothetical protein